MFLLNYNVFSDEINLPPELLWWVYEVKKANENIEIDKFVLLEQKIQKKENSGQGNLLKYPVFMRWNYYGNYAAYLNYHSVYLIRQKTIRMGKQKYLKQKVCAVCVVRGKFFLCVQRP
jgi:hypothetical protein